jgi:two-component system CheB/CheR fusion protein
MPIDSFLRSLAEVAPGRAVGIVLSGTGSDGTIGLRQIKAAGGLTLVQDPASAEYDGMPRSAIDAGVVDHVLPPDGMPAVLLAYARRSHRCDVAGSARPSTIESGELNDLLHVLHARTQFDFRSYKRSTLERRIGRRMASSTSTGSRTTRAVLTDDVAEATALFDDLLISVTGFFRDPRRGTCSRSR